jgi:hypothetical protein
MSGASRAARRTLSGIILLGVAQLGFDALDFYGIRSTPTQIIELLLAVALLVGLVPGSFLSRASRSFGERATTVSPGRLRLLVMGAPLLIMLVMAYLAYGDWTILQLIEDPGPRAGFWFSIAIALGQVVVLGLNLSDLTRLTPGNRSARGS